MGCTLRATSLALLVVLFTLISRVSRVSSRPNPVNCRGTASFDLPSNLEMKLAINHLCESSTSPSKSTPPVTKPPAAKLSP